MHIVLFGPPGVGKGTQAALLISKGYTHLSTGELFREEVKNKTELGLKISELINRGELVDDETVNQVFSKVVSAKNSKFIFDGYPRSLAQFEFFKKIFKPEEVICVFLNAPEDVIIQRILNRGRNDDTPETISHRLEQYYKFTYPVKEFFENSGYRVIELDCSGSIEDIHHQILQILNLN